MMDIQSFYDEVDAEWCGSSQEEKIAVAAATLASYRNGGEGLIKWAEEYVCVPIYPPGEIIPSWVPIAELPEDCVMSTGRSYRYFWEKQKEVLVQALEMKDGQFLHKLIVFCWMRGEGKSAIACLIELWKFMVFPKQTIVLCANSKEQTKFVHFDIVRDMILHSPKLLNIVGSKNIQEKEIRLKDARGNTASLIRPISSFSGIMSNITGYTFSEIFDMKNPRFFYQIDGSTRNTPNALGVIDSTVSEKNHVLKQLYDAYVADKDPTLFFSYRYSLEGNQDDYWHPYNDQKQLDSYASKFPPAEFDRYFKNLWSAGVNKLFTPEMVQATHYVGVGTRLGVAGEMLGLLQKRSRAKEKIEELKNTGILGYGQYEEEIDSINRRLMPLPEFASLTTEYGTPKPLSRYDLGQLGDMYNTDWAILAGADRSDPMKSRSGSGANTIVSILAKGLPGSRNNPSLIRSVGSIPEYIYVMLQFSHVTSAQLEDIKFELRQAHDEYDGIDMLCAERWGMWDIVPWTEEQGIPFEVVSTAYETQKAVFSELFIVYRSGRFKTSMTGVLGVRQQCILEEEAEMFDHDPDKRWYGSPEKKDLNGIQDDSMYSLGYAMYGGRQIDASQFRDRSGKGFFGAYVVDKSLHRRY